MRSIIDRFDSNQRENIIKKYFKEYLPETLFNLLTTEFNEKLGDCPLELFKIYIKWTKSTIDIADAILFALVSRAVLILEG